MNIKVKTVAIPAFVALSLLFGACADQTIETPDALDGAAQEGVEGVEQGMEDAGNAVEDGLNNLEEGAKDAEKTLEDGLKNLEKSAEDGVDMVQDGVNQGLEDAGNTIENLENEVPGAEAEAE